ncbi:MAG: alanine racemase, partial [Verrucomicrobia bacterium]|nr:alanine racemase [Verrucomicrobiota bacterium]
ALPDEHAEIVRRRLVPWISTEAEAHAYAATVARVGAEMPLEVEIEIDTGMGRSGVLPPDFAALRRVLATLPALRLRGLVTHLPSPDEDADFTRAQLLAFSKIVADSENPADARARVHAQNSAGLLGYPLAAGCNSARPGLMLYGASPLPECQALLRPVLTLKTRVTLVRELPQGWGVSYGRTFLAPRPLRVATLAAGYGDGYPRHLSGMGAAVLIRGRRCPLLGRVTMDQLLADVSALEPPAVEPGEEVVLLGRQGGSEEISAGELAARAGTIPWEIFTGLTSRVARRYFGGSG